MKTYITYLILFTILFFTNCKNTNFSKEKENKTLQNTNDIIREKNKINDKFEDSLICDLPVGIKDLFSEKINLGNLNKQLSYYDTINGVPSLMFKPIDIEKYKKFYQPKIADIKKDEDIIILKSKKEYSFFTLVKTLPISHKNNIMIFEGNSINFDYDGNDIYTNRKDLVIIDASNKIIDEMNIYYDYNDGVNTKTKLFYIDKNYNISIRYYSENEEGKKSFSIIEEYKIDENGKITRITKNQEKREN